MKNKKPTILFTYPTILNPTRGGVERVTDTLAKALTKKGYKVLYLHLTNNKENFEGYTSSVPMYFLPSKVAFVQENFDAYHRFLKEQNIDIIVNQEGNYPNSRLFLSLGDNTSIKTISVLHVNPLSMYNHFSEENLRLRNGTILEKLKLVYRAFDYQNRKHAYLKAKKIHYNYLLQNTDILCMLSNKFMPELNQLCDNELISKVNIVSIGNPNSYAVSSMIEKKENIIVFVSRLTRIQKRPDRLLKVWRKLYKDFPDWKLLIIGDGPEKDNLEKESEDLERVYFLGFQDPEYYYKKASVLCMTSDNEGFGMVLTESMQHGVVPVAFNSYASVTDIIEDGKNGILVNPFNLNQYAEKLRSLILDEKKRKNMAKNAFESVKKFDTDSIVGQWEELFDSLLDKK